MFWDVYKSLLACFRSGPTDKTLEEEFDLANLGAEQDDIELISGLQPLHIGDEIVGDGVVLQDDYYAADFTDEEDSFVAK